jgi:tRNA (cytidine/uridine-2'-O-)-methyltransferase
VLSLVLFEPEIPPNTGNVMRLCANTGTHLHLVRPLGFDLSDRQLRRAGLDYREHMAVSVHDSWEECVRTLAGRRLFALTTRAVRSYHEVAFRATDAFILGPETRGLPAHILQQFMPELRLRIPMLPESRSLNLSNAAAVMVYEAWRQVGFPAGR